MNDKTACQKQESIHRFLNTNLICTMVNKVLCGQVIKTRYSSKELLKTPGPMSQRLLFVQLTKTRASFLLIYL